LITREIRQRPPTGSPRPPARSRRMVWARSRWRITRATGTN